MNPQRTRCSTKARMKKSKRDLEMKHKNRSSQTHSKISLQRFEMGEARGVWERVGGVSQVRNGVQIVLTALGREVGGSIYRWSSKLAVWADFSAWDRLNRPLGRLNRPLTGQQTVCQSVCQSDWQTDAQTDRRLVKVDQNRLNRPGGAVEPPLTAPGDLFASLTGRLQIRGQRGQRPAELPLRTSSTGLDQWV